MQDDYQRADQIAPINPLPGVVWLLALPMIAMEIVLSLGGRWGDWGAAGGRAGGLRRYRITGCFPSSGDRILRRGRWICRCCAGFSVLLSSMARPRRRCLASR